MAVSAARCAKIIERASLDFQQVRDPRAANKKHSMEGIVRLIVAGLASSALGFRDIEDLGRDIGSKLRRRLGLHRGPVADNTMWELVAQLESEQFRPVLWEQVNRDLASKDITNDLFAGGVVTLDGKGAGSGMGKAPNKRVRQSSCDAKGTQCWDAFALRACLTSSSARPVLDQEFLLAKEQEPTVFPKVLSRLVEQHPRLFAWVTTDAGLTSWDNARLVRDHGKKYLFALKANFNKLYPLAQRLVADCPVVASSTERADGEEVRRELRRAAFPADYDFPDAAEIWCVRQIRTSDEGIVEAEDRFFIVPEHGLGSDDCLRLVRLHWGIENAANWTADMVLGEDRRCPCKAREGLLVMSWLRLLAYNLLSVFRAHLPRRDLRPDRWAHAARLVYQALFLFEYLWESPRRVTSARARLDSKIV